VSAITDRRHSFISFYFQCIIFIYRRLASLKIAERRPVLAKNW